MNNKRVRLLKKGGVTAGPVIYWMSREQRVNDNWALLAARDNAFRTGSPFAVVFCLVRGFLNAGNRQYYFMLKGLREVEGSLSKKGIPFFLLQGEPEKEIPAFCKKNKVSSIYTDFDPLRIKREWKDKVSRVIDCSLFEVDAHNIVTCWEVSGKQEFAARTIRPKINALLPEFLEEFPPLKKGTVKWPGRTERIDWKKLIEGFAGDGASSVVKTIFPGEKAARTVLRDFLKERLNRYGDERNYPDRDAQSGLSPYLHFGQISAQRVALEVEKSRSGGAAISAFLEELIIRREVADNFCFYNNNYDSFQGFPDWAKRTLDRHRKDKREYIYTLKEFEEAKTHDDLWNDAQNEMVKNGKMHGYMRMYWCKKILEWTRSPEEAIKIAVYLNDKYELDGRDPNGYTGIAWSIGGVHDRPWGERRVFGMIRYMSYDGCKRKGIGYRV